MAVDSENIKTIFDVGATTEFTFAFTFDIINESSVYVKFYDSDGAELSITMNRTTSSTPEANEYYVDKDNGEIIIGDGGDSYLQDQYGSDIAQIVIYREVDYKQEEVIPSSSNLQADSIETALDKTIMALQQLKDMVDRCIKIPIQDEVSVSDLVSAAQRAGYFLAFDDDGNPTVAASVSSEYTISAALQTFVEAATLAAARTILDVYSKSEIASLIGGCIPQSDLLDEDDMASDDDTKPASQQSIAAYVASQIATAVGALSYWTVDGSVLLNNSAVGAAVNTFYDLDTAIGASALCLFRITCNTAAGSGVFKMKQKGDMVDYLDLINAATNTIIFVANDDVSYLTCSADSSGVVQIAADNVASAKFTIELIGYVK